MDATLQALGDLLIKAIPTVLFFLFLTFYLKQVFFKPLAGILDERRKATEGVRELSQRAFEAADRKSSEFETALALARAQISQENDALRKEWEQEELETVARARAEAERKIEEAKHQVAVEVDTAQNQLDTEVELLSDQIIRSLSRRRAA